MSYTKLSSTPDLPDHKTKKKIHVLESGGRGEIPITILRIAAVPLTVFAAMQM